MHDPLNPMEGLLAQLAGERAFAGLRAVAIFDESASTLLYLSPEVARLRPMLADEAGRVRDDLPARERLGTLAAGGAPRDASRAERLRFGRLAPPLPCLCRVATLATGEDVLVVAFNAPAEVALDADRPARVPSTVRFVWQADAMGRFAQISGALAEVVGNERADVLGRGVGELSPEVLRDPNDLAGRLARRETFSGHTLFWRVGDSDFEVPVDMAGAPVYGRDRVLVGFRGFGLIRTEAARRRLDVPQRHDVADAAAFTEDGTPPPPAGAEPPPAAPPEDTWFASIRDLVTETLSSAKAVLRPPGAGRERFSASSEAFASPIRAGKEPSAEPPAGPADDGASASAEEAPPPAAAPPVASQPPERASQPGLTSAERSAFREIARALGARFEDDPAPPVVPMPALAPAAGEAASGSAARPSAVGEVLDGMAAGVLVHRGEEVLFANRHLLALLGYDDLDEVVREGGMMRLFGGERSVLQAGEGGSQFTLMTRANEAVSVEVSVSVVPWDGEPAPLMLIRRLQEDDPGRRPRQADADPSRQNDRVRELEAILDTATDGVIVFDESGRILSLNRSAEALFGYDAREVVGDAITVLLAPESHRLTLDYLDGLRSSGVASLLNDGREVLGRVRQGGAIPLFMTMGTVNEGPARKFCAVLRDITAFKTAECELLAAKRAAEDANAHKSDVLARISHEIRTPLSAILGFAEVMLEERFGPIGNERYKEYLKDVHTSGAHVVSLINDLLDLAKIEAGRMDLSFTRVSLNELVSVTVTLLQPQAARDRIVMRTSFAPKMPPVVADERSIRQIVLNLVSNAIKFTDPGGQVIVSTSRTDRGEVAFRVRDTGIGMSEDEIGQALEPFRQVETARKRGGTGLGLPLTKALVEANRGALHITSNPQEGTLVEVIFPPTRVLAE
jgi:PAS domain S-box-containing protein